MPDRDSYITSQASEISHLPPVRPVKRNLLNQPWCCLQNQENHVCVFCGFLGAGQIWQDTSSGEQIQQNVAFTVHLAMLWYMGWNDMKIAYWRHGPYGKISEIPAAVRLEWHILSLLVLCLIKVLYYGLSQSELGASVWGIQQSLCLEQTKLGQQRLGFKNPNLKQQTAQSRVS